jgi:acetyl esterase/lipase
MAAEQAFEVDVQDVEYQNLNGKSWLARIYQPKGTGPFPAMVDVHGGAWNNGDRTNDTSMDQALASRGIVVAALDFRQPPEAGYPASICDVNLGIRWLKAHAADFNGTTDVGSIGVSSGGHQVVLSGIRPRYQEYATLSLPGHPEIDATVAYVVACWPVIDPLYRFLAVAKKPGHDALAESHIAYWGSEEGMTAGSPQAIVEEDEQIEVPPIFMMLKANDQNHPVEMQDRFASSYRKRGGPIEVETFTGLPERGMDASQPEAKRALDMITEFARRHTPTTSRG